jgi:hypothetical protein
MRKWNEKRKEYKHNWYALKRLKLQETMGELCEDAAAADVVMNAQMEIEEKVEDDISGQLDDLASEAEAITAEAL